MKKYFSLFCMLAMPFTSFAQECVSSIISDVTSDRYALYSGSNGAEIIDLETRLVWRRCVLGQTWNNSTSTCDGTAATYDLRDAMLNAEVVGDQEGFAWRIPNIKELNSLVDYSCNLPAINEVAFPNTPENIGIWTSTPDAISGNANWFVDFQLGTTGGNDRTKGKRLAVRLVVHTVN